MKIAALVTFLFATLSICTQDYSSPDYGQSQCDKYIKNKKSITPNEENEGVKNGYWTYYYNNDDSLVDDANEAYSYLVVELENDYPVALGCYCTLKGRFEGYSSYEKDSWNLDSTSVWYDKKGRLEAKCTYDKGIELRYEEYSKKGYVSYTESYSYTGNDTLCTVKYLRQDGSTIISEETRNGLDHGNYYIYYPNGNKKVEASYDNGVRIHDKYFYKNGQVKFETSCTSEEEPCCGVKYNKEGVKVDEFLSKYRVVSRVTR